MNRGIQAIKKNGTYEKIQAKWFGEYILPYDSKRFQQLFKVLQYLLVLILIFAALVLWWNYVLKKEVRRRTLVILEMNEKLEKNMKELEANNRYKQQILDSAYSSFVTLDDQGRILLYNQNAKMALSWADSVRGMKITETKVIEFIPAHQIESVLQEAHEYILKETNWQTNELRTVSYNILPITIEAGRVTGAVISFIDMTERKHMQEKMQREDRLRSLGQLVSGIAHEIRNPLMSILTYTQLLPRKYDSPAFRNAFIQEVPAEIQRLNHVVNDLVDFARPKKAHPVTFPVRGVMDSLAFLFQPKAKDKGVLLYMEDPSETTFYADPGQIKQVLINLVMNALDATPPGKIITCRAFSEEGITTIEVEDQGQGIASTELERVLEPFYTSKPEGMGLGLSISYQLVQENQGTLEIYSRENIGTTVVLTLMAKEGEQNEASDGH